MSLVRIRQYCTHDDLRNCASKAYKDLYGDNGIFKDLKNEHHCKTIEFHIKDAYLSMHCHEWVLEDDLAKKVKSMYVLEEIKLNGFNL